MIDNIILGVTLGAVVVAAVAFGFWVARRDIRRQVDS